MMLNKLLKVARRKIISLYVDSLKRQQRTDLMSAEKLVRLLKPQQALVTIP